MKKMLAAAVAAVMTMSASMAMADGAIKIGEIGPLTGAAAIYGTAVANGAQIAIDELNARGGQQYEFSGQSRTCYPLVEPTGLLGHLLRGQKPLKY